MELTLKPHPLHWAVEPLFALPSYLEKSMFGCRACYCRGKLTLVLASQEDTDWNGVLVATEKGHHQSLMEQVRSLFPHPVLGKWLYLPLDSDDFESDVSKVVALVERGDERIGVLPGVRKRKRKSVAKKRNNRRKK